MQPQPVGQWFKIHKFSIKLRASQHTNQPRCSSDLFQSLQPSKSRLLFIRTVTLPHQPPCSQLPPLRSFRDSSSVLAIAHSAAAFSTSSYPNPFLLKIFNLNLPVKMAASLHLVYSGRLPLQVTVLHNFTQTKVPQSPFTF